MSVPRSPVSELHKVRQHLPDTGVSRRYDCKSGVYSLSPLGMYPDPRRTGSGKRHTSAGYCGTSDTAIFPRNRKKLLPRTDALYITVYCSAAALSVKISGSAIWSLADLSLAAMTIINLLALLPERQQIAALTFREFSRRRYKRPNKSRNCISTDHGSTTGTVTVEQSSFKQQRRILCANPDRRS